MKITGMSKPVDFSEIIEGFNSGKKVRISFKFPTEKTLMRINSLIAKILARQDRVYLLDSIITIIRELTVNAIKANVKRIYFKKQNLDIHNPEDYTEGMDSFMEMVMKNLRDFKDDLVESEFFINFYLYRQDDGTYIRVINNCSILPVELERINKRKEKASEYDNFSDAYASFYDPAEGAGLGLILVVFLLRNAGIDPGMFRIVNKEKLVSTSIFIPDNLRRDAVTSEIKRRIIEEVDSLPTFPENITKIQELCSQKDVSIETVASMIRVDPSLTAELLKLANSADFYGGKRIETITEAIMRVGLKNIKSLLIVASSRKILDERYKKFEQVWDHCNKVAFYARFIAIDRGYSSLADTVFMSGLLHDIGKIVLLSTERDLVEIIAEIIENRELITTTILEEVTLGISHTTIGRLTAEKWNFPEYLISTIENHHSPLSAGEKYEDIVSLVYLANMLTGIESDKYNFMYLENEILEKYDLTDPELQYEYLDKVKNSFEKQNYITQEA
jgi:putative nucleotidyltransferase with HDIG domain